MTTAEVILTAASLLLAAALVISELSHRKIERGLIDRVLQAAGQKPISEQPEETKQTLKEPPVRERLRFRV